MLALVVAAGLLFMVAERIWPDQDLPRAPGFYLRALLLNLGQLAVVVLAGVTWDRWLRGASLFEVAGAGLPGFVEGLIGYFFTSFVYYWWHRVRHENNVLWLLCHQVHHSPQRIETITSFYKHPVELIINSILSAAIGFVLLGLTIEGAAYVTLLSGLAEYVYHMNIRTPRAMGWFFQRPEMHRIHHERGVHHSNFGDLPLWDMLFGTYKNPARALRPCGFLPERERAFLAMLKFQNVNGPYRPKTSSGVKSSEAAEK